MVLLGELLEICKNWGVANIMLEVPFIVDGEERIFKIPMVSGHYIEDSIWYSLACKTVGDLKGSTPTNSQDFIFEMERECLDNPDNWGDLYDSPMEQLGNCELRFCRDMKHKEETSLEPIKIEETDNEIIIKFKE